MKFAKGKVVSILYGLKNTTGEVLESFEEELFHGHVHGTEGHGH